MSTNEAQTDVFTVPEVAQRLGISKATAYAAVREGRIPAIWLGPRRVIVPKIAFERMLAEGKAA